jgi:phosphoserine phosphatase RsbU/P
MKKQRTDRPDKQEITVRKRTGERIFLLAQALDNSSELIGMADREGRLTFVNRAFLQALGRPKEEVIGKHFEIALSANNPPELIQEIGEKIFKDEGWRGECLFSHQDGSGSPIFLSAGPVKDQKGRVIGSFGIGQDISDRKRVEEALRQRKRRQRRICLCENSNRSCQRQNSDCRGSPDASAFRYLQ